MSPTLGVLALQGDFREHCLALEAVGADALPVRRQRELDRCDGLILPGGESTTIARLLLAEGLHAPIRDLGQSGFPLWGTCAGAILLATEVGGGLDRPGLCLVPMTIDRNAYGRQVDSFETDLETSGLGLSDTTPLHAIFIRAPRIREIDDGVEVLLRHAGDPVAVRYGAILATTFHPELTTDRRLHAYFVERCLTPTQPIAPAAGGGA